FSHRFTQVKHGHEKSFSFRVHKSVKIRVHLWLSVFASSCAHRKSPCPPAPESRPPRPRRENHWSFPWKAAAVSGQILSRARLAIRATAQGKLARLPLLRRVAECT